MTFWEWERLVMQAVFLGLLWRAGSILKQLLREGQLDRLARETVITDLKDTAIALADRTKKILADSEARTATAERKLEAVLLNPPNRETLQQIETNTRDTADSARDAANALKDKP